MERLLKINLVGPSGMGKTTLAKWISDKYNIPFVSGSYSDLVPSTAKTSQGDMVNAPVEEILRDDYKLLNLRKKLYYEHENHVSDRSFVDSAAYFINKLSHRVQQCETENFIEICRSLTLAYSQYLIYLPAGKEHINKWMVEDNHKRSTNLFYHIEISQIIDWLMFDFWGFEKTGGNYRYKLDNLEDHWVKNPYKLTETKLLVIPTVVTDFEHRCKLVSEFIENE